MRIALTLIPILLIIGVCPAGTEDQDAPDIRPRRDLRGHRGAVKHIAFSPDGKQLVSASADGRIKLWDVKRGRQIRELYPRGRTIDANLTADAVVRNIEDVAFSSDGKTIIEATREPSQETILRAWSVDGGEPRVLARGRIGIRCLCCTPDGKYVITNEQNAAKWEHDIVLRDVQTGKVAERFSGKRLAVTHMAISPDGKLLATTGARSIQIWDLKTRRLLNNMPAHKKAIHSIAFSPNGKLLVSASADDTIRIWRVDSGKLDREIECEQDGVYAACFSPSGKSVLSAGADNTIKAWKPKSGMKYLRLWGHLDKVLCLAFSPDGTLASGSRDTTIALWDFKDPEKDEQEEEPDDDWMD